MGLDETGAERFAVPLPHGADPETLAYDLGYLIERPIEAFRDPSGELVGSFAIRPLTGEARPSRRRASRDAELTLAKDEVPTLRQRIAAYAVVVSPRGLLATEYSSTTAVVGRWGMPGGGIDADEDPRATAVREVQEETAQTVELGDLVAVQTSHWVGRSPTRHAEDFHAVRLIYRAVCPEPGDPVVLDVGGTTAAARWVELAQWRHVAWTANWRQALEKLLPS
ncbi:MAG: NUDIX domain-containing protein [Microlunatus sp.]|nr:NUDIX domain-containing protein [Microlunatus sp.]